MLPFRVAGEGVLEGGADHGRRHTDVGDDMGDGKAVGQVRVAAAASLSRVPAGGLLVGEFDGSEVGGGVVYPHGAQQAVEGRADAVSAARPGG